MEFTNRLVELPSTYRLPPVHRGWLFAATAHETAHNTKHSSVYVHTLVMQPFCATTTSDEAASSPEAPRATSTGAGQGTLADHGVKGVSADFSVLWNLCDLERPVFALTLFPTRLQSHTASDYNFLPGPHDRELLEKFTSEITDYLWLKLSDLSPRSESVFRRIHGLFGHRRYATTRNSGLGSTHSATSFPEIHASASDSVAITNDWNGLMFVWSQKALLGRIHVFLDHLRYAATRNSPFGLAHSATDLSRKSPKRQWFCGDFYWLERFDVCLEAESFTAT
jgi:hypothetical protein